MTPLEMVREFHEAFGVPAYATPVIPPLKRQALRQDLMDEEHDELNRAIRSDDLVAIADALADLTVTVYGTALEYGINLDAVLEEVHRSNMAKLGSDGKPILREDGKVLKPQGWQPPDIARVLAGKR